MKNKHLLSILIAVVAMFALGLFVWQSRSALRPAPPASIQALGVGMAEQTARVLGNKGRIVVIAFDPRQAGGAPLAGRLQAFTDALKTHGEIAVVATEFVRPYEFALTDMETALNADLFLQVLADHRSLDAVVSFVGAPALTAAELSRITPPVPRLIVSAPFSSSSHLRALVAQNLIQVGIVPRDDVPAASGHDLVTPQEWFDYLYQVITPAAS
jgi:hypothetical protein